jgi:hypothetical protein
MQGKTTVQNIKAILIKGPNLLYHSHVEEYKKTDGTLVIIATSPQQVIDELTNKKDLILPNVRIDLDCHGYIHHGGNHTIVLDAISKNMETRFFSNNLVKFYLIAPCIFTFGLAFQEWQPLRKERIMLTFCPNFLHLQHIAAKVIH